MPEISGIPPELVQAKIGQVGYLQFEKFPDLFR